MRKIVGWLLGIGLVMGLFACGTGNDGQNLSGNEDQQIFDQTISAQSSINTRLKSKPANPSHTANAAFKFTCTSSPCTYKCNLDSAGWKKCKSPKTYTDLADGSHNFQVKATKNGHTDRSPAKYDWTIQTNFWIATSTTNAPDARYQATAVWTGTQMIVWGGGIGNPYYNTGGRYDPIADSWTPTSTTNAPDGRYAHTAVWTGTRMMVWGGYNGTNYLNTGGIYNPGDNSWTATAITNAPSNRSYHTAVWDTTNSQMIVWGGYFYDTSNHFYNDGGRYNPSANSWTATSTTNAPDGREYHSAVWTTGLTTPVMIVWGGYDTTLPLLNTGSRYDPSANSWTETSTTNAPDGREYHTAVWTSGLTTPVMIVWAGYDGTALNTGSRYDPSADSWTATSTDNAPSARAYHSAVWTSGLTTPVMIIWGGNDGDYSSTGGKYDPMANSWTETSTTNAPSGRWQHSMVWTGTRMIVWGGNAGAATNTGGVYWP